MVTGFATPLVSTIAIVTELWGAMISLMIIGILLFQKNRSEIDRDIEHLVFFVTLILLNDPLVYLFQGNMSKLAYYSVRISNFVVFIASYGILCKIGQYFTHYLNPTDKKEILIYRIVWLLGIASILLTIFSQFTGFLFYFDLGNCYHRTRWYFISQIAPVVGVFLYGFLIVKNRNNMRRNTFIVSCAYIILPIIAVLLQNIFFGLPLQNVAMATSIWLLFMNREVEIRKELEEANQVKLNFLRRMSHDVRTPLNAILGLIAIDEKNEDNIELLKENREKMKISAKHLFSLVNDILETSKIESKKMELPEEAMDLKEVLSEVQTIIELRCADKNINLISDKGEGLMVTQVLGSSLHVKQIFLNILTNAVKYNKPEGSIICSTRLVAQDNYKVIYEFEISDTGMGMSEEFLNHIFEPFSQEKSNARSHFQGTGMGMAIVKGLVDQMGGSIRVESTVNIGSDFTIILPFKINHDALISKNTNGNIEEKEVSFAGAHVLLAEDNEINSEIAIYLLEEAGMVVDLATNGEEVVQKFEENEAGSYDIILMDIMMPVFDGYEAAKQIRLSNKKDATDIKIIAMTANTFSDDIKKAKQAGMNDYIAKPIEEKLLLRTIAKYL